MIHQQPRKTVDGGKLDVVSGDGLLCLLCRQLELSSSAYPYKLAHNSLTINMFQCVVSV